MVIKDLSSHPIPKSSVVIKEVSSHSDTPSKRPIVKEKPLPLELLTNPKTKPSTSKNIFDEEDLPSQPTQLKKPLEKFSRTKCKNVASDEGSATKKVTIDILNEMDLGNFEDSSSKKRERRSTRLVSVNTKGKMLSYEEEEEDPSNEEYIPI